MHYPRPFMQAPARAIKYGQTPYATLQQGLADLADLGDVTEGSAAQATFQEALKNHIIVKAGPQNLANGNAVRDLANLISFAAVTYQLGSSGSLQPTQQSYWNSWQAAASNINSNDHIAWLFGKFVYENKNALMVVASGFQPASAGSQVVYTLMDTSTSGTTWYGGTSTASKLTNPQWASLFTRAWDVILKGASNGVLPLSYLSVIVRAFVQADPVARRLPTFSTPPGGVPLDDPRAIAFRAAFKQLGWSSVVQTWFGYTQQNWAASQAAQESNDAYYTAAITALSYVSGAKILDQIETKLAEYWQVRADAAKCIMDYDLLSKGPLASAIPADAPAKMAQIRADFNSIDKRAFDALNAVGMWPSGTKQGLSGLGFVTAIVYGTVGVTLLGVVAYIVSLMTNTSRVAVSQTKAISDSILSSIGVMQNSCAREYAQSAKGPADEAKFRACSEKVTTLTASIPKPPEGTNDPLGFKGMALAATALVGGIVVIGLMRKSKQPKSFKVVPE